VVDRTIAAQKVASIRDAVRRIREVLPADLDRFLADRTAREVVVLNLFVALEDALALAAHWLADAGYDVPASYRDVLRRLADAGVVDTDLSARLAAAMGLRNLIAHRYGSVNWATIHDIAHANLDDLLEFCRVIAERTDLS
jgi:uncharacterized protein YutE (UPF0331/DUF86 family)